MKKWTKIGSPFFYLININMEQITFLSSVFSLLFLLLVSTGTYLISKKINFPYTVLLVIVWLLLIPLSNTQAFDFINHFKLTPDVLFYVFLPILLFESAYNINYRELLKNWKTIWSLAVFWLIISSIVIAIWLYYIFPLIGLNIPFLVCLLFWTLISATDPVAVLAIFKTIWAPRRLALIFEWESLFNDWTALALFLVVLWIILEWTTFNSWVLIHWSISFLSMAIWWMIFWWITWVIFSKIIGKIKNNEALEITLTMVLAHLTFILAESITHFFHHTLHIEYIWISGVISTVVAWIIIGNYGRYKISPKVEKHMEMFWEYFAFIANSLVFILMWLILADLNINFQKFIPAIIIIIIVVAIARAISVYLPISIINFFKIEEKIPLSWQHLLSWWSLRGALALMMALLIPWPWEPWYDKILEFQQKVGWNFDFDIKDFILVLTIWAIMFTLLIKATTIAWLMKKLWVTKLHPLEKFEYDEAKILANIKILNQLQKVYNKWYLTFDEYSELKNKYEEKLNQAIKELKELLKNEWNKAQELIKRAVSLYALWVEKRYLKELFEYNEIKEENFKFILRKINRQIERLEHWDKQFSKDLDSNYNDHDIFEKISELVAPKKEDHINKYMRNRARTIITRKVIKELESLLNIDFWFDKKIIENVIETYKKFNEIAKKKMEEIAQKYKSSIMIIEANLTNKTLLKIEEKVINELYEKEIITPKLYIKFKEEIEKGIEEDIKKVAL